MSNIDPTTQAELEEFLVVLGDAAAAAILPYFRQRVEVDNKGGVHDFDPVTEADRAAEMTIRSLISERYPDDSISGEEFPPVNGSSDFAWVIDPIDGTRAFVCGLPTWATLIALCQEGVPIAGSMYQPVVGDRFIGGFGRARLIHSQHETALRTSDRDSLQDCSLFATSPDMFRAADEQRAFARLSQQVRMTRYGVDSYAYCVLAAGFVDLVVETDLGFYDVAALIPLIEDAGGVVSDWHGAPVRQGGQVIAAANETIHAAALAVLAG